MSYIQAPLEIDFIKDGTNQTCVVQLQHSKEKIPTFHSRILNVMAQKSEISLRILTKFLELLFALLLVSSSSIFFWGFLGFDYKMPDNRKIIDKAYQQNPTLGGDLRSIFN